MVQSKISQLLNQLQNAIYIAVEGLDSVEVSESNHKAN